MESFVLLLEADKRAHWTIVDQEGERIAPIGFNTLEEIGELIGNRRVIIFIYSKFVNLFKTQIPSRQHTKIQQAIPFALENQIAEDIRNIHFSYIEQKPKQQLVTVIAKNELDDILSLLEDNDIKPDRIYPTFAGVPYKEHHWTLLISLNEVVLNIEYGFAFWFDIDDAPFMLEKLLKQHPRPKQLRVFLMQQVDLKPLIEVLQKYQVTYYIDDRTSYSTLSVLAATIPELPETNLLETSFVSKHNLAITKRYWRAAIIAFVFALLSIGTRSGFVYRNLVHQDLETVQQIKQFSERLFPHKIMTHRELRNALQAKLSHYEALKQYPLLDLIETTGALLSEKQQTFKLIELNFQPNQLVLSLETYSPEHIDALIKAYNAHRMKAEQIQYEIKGRVISTSLRVEKL